MQTFLPYSNFEESLKCLDNKRLGKQRVEAWQVLKTLRGLSTGWVNHPAVRMWRGFVPALTEYYNLSLDVWESRGFNNIVLESLSVIEPVVMPPWVGQPSFHLSHKSNLLRKNQVWYRKFWPEIPDNLPYIWPQSF